MDFLAGVLSAFSEFLNNVLAALPIAGSTVLTVLAAPVVVVVVLIVLVVLFCN